MTNNRGPLSEISKLVELRAEEEIEKKIAKLTHDNEVRFKILFSHQLEEQYNFESLQTLIDPDRGRQLDDNERLDLYDYLASCIDTYIGRSITNVEMHFRREDTSDKAYDPVGGAYMQVQHFSIDAHDKARVHGYFNHHGYFVVTRLDWLHLYHLRSVRSKATGS